jgi:hypothetical protein
VCLHSGPPAGSKSHTKSRNRSAEMPGFRRTLSKMRRLIRGKTNPAGAIGWWQVGQIIARSVNGADIGDDVGKWRYSAA